MSDRAVVRWTVWIVGIQEIVSAPTVAACRQFELLCRRERTIADGCGDEHDRGLGWPNRTCLHRRLTVIGQNLNCFSFPNFTSRNTRLSPSTSFFWLLLLVNCFFKCPQWHILQCTNWEKNMLDYSWPFHLGEFYSLCLLGDKEKQCLNLKWGRKPPLDTVVVCQIQNGTDWNKPHLMMR